MLKPFIKSRGALQDALQNLRQGIRAVNRQRLHRRRMKKGVDYATWIARHDTPTGEDRASWEQWLDNQVDLPIVTLVLHVPKNSDEKLLERSIASVRAQIYPHWQMIFAMQDTVHGEYKKAQEARIQVVSDSENIIQFIKGQWTVFLNLGDQLRPHTLLTMLQMAHAHHDAKIIYSDDDEIDAQGTRSSHHFKPDWNYDFQLSSNYIRNAFFILSNHLLERVSDRFELSDVGLFKIVLQCTEGLGPSYVVHIQKILWHHAKKAEQVSTLGGEFLAVLQEHLDRVSPGAQSSATEQGLLRVRYALPQLPPLVSIVICTRNQYKLLHTCISSVQQKTNYPRYEVIVVDNGSDEERALSYLRQLPAQDHRIKVVRDDSPFNYSALNNMAVRQSKGEVIALLNNDIEVISPDWLTDMVRHALRPEVGCVGAKLLYPDETIQHAGVLAGADRDTAEMHVAHYFRGMPRDEKGYANRAIVTQEVTAVTAACLVVRKEIFMTVGGLDQENLAVAYNDVDFCLRVGELGLHHIFVPDALLYHHESVSRGRDVSMKNQARFLPEKKYIQKRWVNILSEDRFYNKNLSDKKPDFLLAR